MNVAALPHTLFIILAELAVGSLWATTASDLRGGVTRGFVLTMALLVAVTGGLALWVTSGIEVGTDIDGYAVASGWFGRLEAILFAVTILAAVYAAAVFMGWDPLGRLAGLAGSAAGLIAVGAMAAFLAPPAWSAAGVFAGLLAGTLAMGAVAVAMTWGHWYLTEGALPGRPLRELALLLIAAELFQGVTIAVALSIPVSEAPTPANPVDVALVANPVLYLRIAVGLLFPLVLAVLAYQTARIRAMQSATGLLYNAMGAVFVGEVLGKGLMFMTGRAL
ncbi:MAG: hypothetical protein ACE5EF_06460 [Dehalococcoidia bacterium]